MLDQIFIGTWAQKWLSEDVTRAIFAGIDNQRISLRSGRYSLSRARHLSIRSIHSRGGPLSSLMITLRCFNG
ncbi:hypothetical protein ACLOJK_027476 [Asimina triloba]